MAPWIVLFGILSGCDAVRTCVGDDCACTRDDDCGLVCDDGCDCTSGSPVAESTERECGTEACAATMCATWTEYEPRCWVGSCVAVVVDR